MIFDFAFDILSPGTYSRNIMPKPKRALFICFLFIICIYLFLSPKTITQASDAGSSNQNWQCLDTKQVGAHSVELLSKTSNQFPLPGSPIYIVECISTDSGNKCTTGQSSSDQELFGNNNDFNFLTNSSKYLYKRVRFSGTTPMFSDYNGNLPSDPPIIWESQTKTTTGHTFFGVGILPEIIQANQNPSLQMGTFYFPNSSESCSSIRWDPYGRIFDSKSLEPISNAIVTLYSKTGTVSTPVNIPGVTNPQNTLEDGMFSFIVPDGTYILTPNVSGHGYPNNILNLNPGYSKAYSDIYRGEDIIQAGSIQHRDIPVDPSGIPFTSPIKIMDYSIVLNKVYAKYIITGALSHPLSTVKVENSGKLLTTVTANKFGRFDISLDTSNIDTADEINLNAEKVNLAATFGLDFFVPKAVAQTIGATVAIEPILNNLEGFAYNGTGNILPNASVNIFLTSSSKSFYHVQADGNGYFFVPSQLLPPLPFIIQITSTNGIITILTPTQFASLNKKYSSERNINYLAYNPQPVIQTSSETTVNNNTANMNPTITGILNPTYRASLNENRTSQNNSQNNGYTDMPLTPPANNPTASNGRPVSVSSPETLLFSIILAVLLILVAYYLYKKLHK